MRVGSTDLLCLLLIIASLGISSCATKKLYHGVEATDLTDLFYGMRRLNAEKIIGSPKREFQCDSGSIVTYVYDRGYTGCVEDRSCDPEKETGVQTIEIIGDVFYFGMMSMSLNECITPCQEGHLELFFDRDNRLIGVRELPSDRDDFCWNKREDKCARYYNYRQPSSISKSLIFEINPEDIPDKICDQFTQ
jgi:hypothetical protein